VEVTSREFAIEMHRALQVLTRFFEARRQECESPGIDRQIVENERRLNGQFGSFMVMLAMTPCELDMDKGRRWPPFKSWRDVARFLANPIKRALEDSNPGEHVGFSDDGPVVCLTMAILNKIAGDDTKLRPKNKGTLAQYLRDRKIPPVSRLLNIFDELTSIAADELRRQQAVGGKPMNKNNCPPRLAR
jgi:hypothetical protein